MPMPYEYLHADQLFNRFIDDAQKALGHATRNQTYTTVQAVLLVFRSRLEVGDGLKFSDTLPAILRAIFVKDWEINLEPKKFLTAMH